MSVLLWGGPNTVHQSKDLRPEKWSRRHVKDWPLLNTDVSKFNKMFMVGICHFYHFHSPLINHATPGATCTRQDSLRNHTGVQTLVFSSFLDEDLEQKREVDSLP